MFHSQLTLLKNSSRMALVVLAGSIVTSFSSAEESDKAGWWKPEWTQRQQLTIRTGADAGNIAEPIGSSSVLLRLHDGNFNFGAVREDGSDLRLIAADGKTLLPLQIEKFDAMLHEAIVWVKVPDIKSGGDTAVSLYYGNVEASNEGAPKDVEVHDKDTALVYHFNDRSAAPKDATGNACNAETAGIAVEGALVGPGVRLAGGQTINVPSNAALTWKQAQPLTIATWIKPSNVAGTGAVLLERAEAGNALRLILDQGVLYAEISNNGQKLRSAAGAPLSAGTWAHVAFVAEAGKAQLYVNGAAYSSVSANIPALSGLLSLGGPIKGNSGANYDGELDEFSIANVARTAGWVKFQSVTQGVSELAQKTVALGEASGTEAKHESKMLEHLSLFGDIANNMMFDGWIAIGICVVMIIVGWTVAIRKFLYLNSIQKGGVAFLKLWKELSSDLTVLDDHDGNSSSALAAKVDSKTLANIQKSPLYHVYHIGSEEIRHRIENAKDGNAGLSERSIHAVRASLDAGIVHENHRMTNGLVFLTISIAGGPYVGLLGTVVGVMITFAIIAKSGEVDVNSIAPGIASALLATVVGLLVAIPALFIYSYLNGRIKEMMGLMQVFADEFIAKMAEFYPIDSKSNKSQD